MSASIIAPQNDPEAFGEALDNAKSAKEVISLLTPDPNDTMEHAAAKLATLLVVIDEESVSFKFGPLILTATDDGLPRDFEEES